MFEAVQRQGDVRCFHYRDGLFFARQEDGAVRIIQGETVIGIVDSYSWASVVASMSASGETGITYELARDFHTGKPTTE